MTRLATAAPPPIAAAPPPSATDDDRAWLRERVVVHKVLIVMDAVHPCLSDLLDGLHRAQGAVQSLSLRPSGEGFEAVLHACRLTPEAARRLVDRYAAHPQVGCALIEHMLVR